MNQTTNQPGNGESDECHVSVQPFVTQLSKTHTLIRGDSLEVCSQWPDDAAIVADPPYGQKYKSNHNTGRGDCDLIRKDGNWSAIEGDDQPFDPSPWLRFRYVCLFGAQLFSSRLPDRRGWLVWDKLAGKTPASGSDCELAWTNREGPARLFTHLWRGIMRAGEENVVHSAKLHPHQKPVALMKWAIDMLQVPPGTTVYDPYMGSGTVGVACHRLKLPYVGVEIDGDYFRTAEDRLRSELRKPRLFAG